MNSWSSLDGEIWTEWIRIPIDSRHRGYRDQSNCAWNVYETERSQWLQCHRTNYVLNKQISSQSVCLCAWVLLRFHLVPKHRMDSMKAYSQMQIEYYVALSNLIVSTMHRQTIFYVFNSTNETHIKPLAPSYDFSPTIHQDVAHKIDFVFTRERRRIRRKISLIDLVFATMHF